MGKERKPLSPGDRFGMLTVIGKDEKRTKERKKQYYFCQCDCGSPVKSIMKASLVSKSHPTYSCGCHTKYKAGYIDNRDEALAKILYGKLKVRHIQKLGDSEDTLIPFEDFMRMIKEPCHYCGALDASYITDRRDNATQFFYNGLDRVDSNIGYRLSNVVAACSRCNIAKGELSESDFAWHIKRIHDFQTRKRERDV